MNTPNPQHPLIQAFAFDSRAVRVVHKEGRPWFVAKDVCECLGIANHRDAASKLDADERDGVGITDAIGRMQDTTVVSESGLYAIILRCDGAVNPGHPAHTFRKWVTSEVLPALRQNGRYVDPAASDTPAAGASLAVKVDKLLDLMEQMLRVIPKVLEATHPKAGRSARKRLYREDVARIQALRSKGYTLDDLVAETEFSQSQCWSVVSGRYKVLESGRVSIDLRSDSARAADVQAKVDRLEVGSQSPQQEVAA